jgi:hypothetical protein
MCDLNEINLLALEEKENGVSTAIYVISLLGLWNETDTAEVMRCCTPSWYLFHSAAGNRFGEEVLERWLKRPGVTLLLKLIGQVELKLCSRMWWHREATVACSVRG